MQNKVVIITGASSGIGKALVYEFAKRGAKIAMGARNLDELHKIETDLKSRGVDALSVQTDVTREADCKNLIEKTVERFGKIDILVNNAGISMRALFEDLELDVIRRLMDVNFWGTVYCTKFALPYILKAKGSLVGIISVAGFLGLPGRTGYSASKFAVRGFLNTLRVENLKKGLHVLVPVFQCCVQKRRHLLCRTAGDFCRNLHALQAQSDDLFSCVSGCVHAVVPPFVVVFVRPPGQLSVSPPSP